MDRKIKINICCSRNLFWCCCCFSTLYIYVKVSKSEIWKSIFIWKAYSACGQTMNTDNWQIRLSTRLKNALKKVAVLVTKHAYMKNHWEIFCDYTKKSNKKIIINSHYQFLLFDQTQRVHLVFKTFFQVSDIDAFYNTPSWCRISDGEKKEYYNRYLFCAELL